MTHHITRHFQRLIPVILAATAAAAPAPKPAPIHLAAPPVTTAAAPAKTCPPPPYVGQWMDQNNIPHTAPFFPEPIAADPRHK